LAALHPRGRQEAVPEEEGVQRETPDERAIPPPDESAPEQLEPGLWRIPLPLPFALRSANVYLIADGAGGWTLIDAGLGLPADEAALRAGLVAAGVTLADVTSLVLTHAHPDHIGLAGPIHAAGASPVYMLAGEDERMYRVWLPSKEDSSHDATAPLAALYAAHGLSQEEALGAQQGTERLRSILRLAPPSALRPLKDGAELRLGHHTYRAIWTPGHSDYHLCLLREDGLFIAGDHILPGITPNIGWYPDARPDPLGDYDASLAAVRDLPVRLVLPGHRRPFSDLAGRVDELRHHHRERGASMLALLAASDGGLSAAQVAAALFGERLRNGDDRRFALVEMLAHLEHLRLRGVVRREERGGLIYYLAASGATIYSVMSAVKRAAAG
jgi:glyoxylase-like metal-dependent hydrolase (beta-lactamase superfamily II)